MNKITYFANAGIEKGKPVTCIPNTFPTQVKKYDGKQCDGISCHNVVEMPDLTTTPVVGGYVGDWDTIADGSMIHVVRRGYITIQIKDEIKVGDKLGFSKSGNWRKRLRYQFWKPIAIVEKVKDPDGFCVVYFDCKGV